MEIPGYTLKHRIAQGRYAVLYLAENERGETRAIKIIHSSLANQYSFRQAFKNKIQHLIANRNDHCMHVYDAGITGRNCYIVMDYYPNGSIAPRLIFGFPVKKITKIILELISAVEFLNSKGLKHGNIQPRNIFINKDNQAILSEYEIVPQILKEHPDIQLNEDNPFVNQLLDTQSDLSCLGLVFFKLLNRETTPYLEIPVHGLSGKRADCWQPTIKKLFSNRDNEKITTIDQFRQEIFRVQDVFNNKNIKQTPIVETNKVETKVEINDLAYDEIDKAFESTVAIKTDTKHHNFPVLVKNTDASPKNKFNALVNNFLLNNKTAIMTSLAASTSFFIALSAYTIFSMFNGSFNAEAMSRIGNSVVNTVEKAHKEEIKFPREFSAKTSKYPVLVTSIEELQNTNKLTAKRQLTQSDINQKKRLAAMKQKEKQHHKQEESLAIIN